jgi:hypothetical protein
VTERAIQRGALMTRKTHGDPFGPSVERIAQTLLQFACQQPALVGRPGPMPVSPAPAKAATTATQMPLASKLRHSSP